MNYEQISGNAGYKIYEYVPYKKADELSIEYISYNTPDELTMSTYDVEYQMYEV